MEQNVNKILKHIEDDANSIAKKRPEAISLVHKCHHTYRSLAESYKQDTGGSISSISTTVGSGRQFSLPTILSPGSKQLKRLTSAKRHSGVRSRTSVLQIFNHKAVALAYPMLVLAKAPRYHPRIRGLGVLDVASIKPSTIPSPPPLPKFPSSKQLHVPLPKLSSGSKQLKRLVSVKRSKYHNIGKIPEVLDNVKAV
ncbi:hypothetical protein K7X08_003488 [Anisodus acutangulus]|uniref:NAB domain-containing protein n=1 Tax=Anisodus acutangulus TaxID=402998 RepID=A0A9Q1MFF0_9SOLA|nr:hypothetical protein K7X08_003488 [Anisodus acutangulus]